MMTYYYGRHLCLQYSLICTGLRITHFIRLMIVTEMNFMTLRSTLPLHIMDFWLIVASRGQTAPQMIGVPIYRALCCNIFAVDPTKILLLDNRGIDISPHHKPTATPCDVTPHGSQGPFRLRRKSAGRQQRPCQSQPWGHQPSPFQRFPHPEHSSLCRCNGGQLPLWQGVPSSRFHMAKNTRVISPPNAAWLLATAAPPQQRRAKKMCA